VNALLSFVYTLLAHGRAIGAGKWDWILPWVFCIGTDRAARTGFGFDGGVPIRDRGPACAFLDHSQTSGLKGFTKAQNGAVVMDDATRKTVLVEYQNRKQDEVAHPLYERKDPIGLCSSFRRTSWRVSSGATSTDTRHLLEVAMLVLVSYDVAIHDARRLASTEAGGKTCVNGDSGFNSASFECVVDPAQWVGPQNRLCGSSTRVRDSLGITTFGSNWKRKIEHVGANASMDVDEPIIV
jgi:CRISPR/Cas system-associated endoribonuclease Cas2